MTIFKNKIHQALKENGLADPDAKKGKRRKWIRYENSMKLWYTDWAKLDKWFIAYLDDAFQVCCGLWVVR